MASETQTSSIELVAGIPTRQAISYRHEQTSTSTSWVITHSLGLQYVNVEVSDSSDVVLIPDTITYNTSNQLTVTFATSRTGKAVITR